MQLFVYGTLKKGYPNHSVLEDSKFIREDKIEGLMVSLGSFPAVIRDPNFFAYGEIYEVDERVLTRADILEGHPSLYQRGETSIPGVQAYFLPKTYFSSWNGIKFIPNGKW